MKGVKVCSILVLVLCTVGCDRSPPAKEINLVEADLGRIGEVICVVALVAVGIIIWKKLGADNVQCPKCKHKNALVEKHDVPATIVCESCDYCVSAIGGSWYRRLVGRERIVPGECPQCLQKKTLVRRGGGPTMMVCKFCDYSRQRIDVSGGPIGGGYDGT
jgi:transcription elongation factor Elf1